MKILIWFLCMLAYGVITTFINGIGITLGGMPTFILIGMAMALAYILCKVWDAHKANKAYKESDENSEDTEEDLEV